MNASLCEGGNMVWDGRECSVCGALPTGYCRRPKGTQTQEIARLTKELAEANQRLARANADLARYREREQTMGWRDD